MKIVRVGDRGAAVEDIQRRLLTLGYDLGYAGVDGVFLEGTAAAIREFQTASGLYADGLVGPRTWSALVDSTFAFGDRMLYLRTPFFHGNDVLMLQRALNSLGFVCGAEDAIFGTYTERAVVEFQQNAGLETDGIVGPSSFAALNALRHIWGPRASGPHSHAHGAPVDRADVLGNLSLAVVAGSPEATDIARRLANVAQASSSMARVAVLATLEQAERYLADLDQPSAQAEGGSERSRSVTLVLVVATATTLDPGSAGDVGAQEASPRVPYLPDRDAMAQAIRTALISGANRSPVVTVAIGNESFNRGSKQGIQRVATSVLDALCTALR